MKVRRVILGVVAAIIMLPLAGVLIVMVWKELKLATVDASLAALLGFHPVVVHYGLMTMVSVTARPRISARV